MSHGDDGDRPRRSWSEIDKLRDKPRARQEERRPRGAHAEARAKQAAKEYLKEVDRRVFSGREGGADRALADAVREAHGTSGLADACRAYRDAAGMPEDPALLSLFLDAGDAGIVVGALETLLALQERGGLEAGSGLRTQLRLLSQGFDDEVAEAAETLLERL